MPNVIQFPVSCRCQRVMIAGKVAIFPDWLPSSGWSLDGDGYPIYTSRRKQSLMNRGARMNRVIMRVVAGDKFDRDAHTHHQDFNKMNNCPWNLIQTPTLMNPSPAVRCPWTGRFISPDEFRLAVAA